MPYIGKNPVGGGFHKLDNLTASATDTYALTLGSAAYFPESANQLLVSLNGVIQAPQDSFTVSGSDLVFDSPLTGSDSIDFVVALGDVLAVKTVTDGAITAAKLGNGAVTDAKIDTMAATKLTGTIDNARMPAGSVIQVVQNTFAPASSEQTNSTSYQSSAWNITVQKKQSDSKLLVTCAGAHSYVYSTFGNGCISTICQESGSSTFTASTTYASGNDPASSYIYGMQQVYNSTNLNTAPHSKNWLFDSSGNEFEAFRLFFKSRTSGRDVTFFEAGHVATITVMEVAQ